MPRRTSHESFISLCFAITVFWSALLLFQIQPLIAKFILPWFGGSPTVWTICLLFFQSMLFVGYAYAHGLSSVLPLRWQPGLHVLLLAAALALLPITPSAVWKPAGSEDPTWRIVALLTACIGLPYLLLSATGPLLQAWFSRLPHGVLPYRLYAISNLGSLIALVSYPFVVDPAMGAVAQTAFWSWLFAGFALVCGGCAWLTFRRGRGEPQHASPGNPETAARAGWPCYAWWFALSLVPSMMLLAATNQICIDVAVVPFLWILPLTLYLLSFILCFHSLAWSPRNVWAGVWIAVVIVAIPVMFLGRGVTTSLPIAGQVAVYCGLLFAGCMVCHGELVRRKPEPSRLTSFYLILSAGGAAGGLFVGLVAPRVFPIYVELSLAMVACTLLLLGVYYTSPTSRLRDGRPRWAWLVMAAGTLAMIAALSTLFQTTLAGVKAVYRNFYGVLMVGVQSSEIETAHPIDQLIHGRTMHGMQYVSPQRRRWPTSYYGPDSGIGLVLENHRVGPARNLGVVGLGVGTLAAYGKPEDRFRFYEINPAVITVAEGFFFYLDDCPSSLEIIPGDARISLEREPSQQFDVLVLDAFSSDAIPIHLLTEEAFEIYLGHLKPDGILAVHISNVHVDLRPVLAGHAQRLGLREWTVDSAADPDRGLRAAVWCLLAADSEALEIPALRSAALAPGTRRLHWTDDRSSLLDVLK